MNNFTPLPLTHIVRKFISKPLSPLPSNTGLLAKIERTAEEKLQKKMIATHKRAEQISQKAEHNPPTFHQAREYYAQMGSLYLLAQEIPNISEKDRTDIEQYIEKSNNLLRGYS